MDNPMRSPAVAAPGAAAAAAAAPAAPAALRSRPPAVVNPTFSPSAPAGGGSNNSSSSTTTANVSEGDVVYSTDAGNNTYDAWGTTAPVYAVPTSRSARAANSSAGGGAGAGGSGGSVYDTAAHPNARQAAESAEYSHLSQDPAHRQHNNVQIQQEDQNNLYDLGPPQRRGQRGGQQQQPEQNNLYDLGPQQQRGNQTNA